MAKTTEMVMKEASQELEQAPAAVTDAEIWITKKEASKYLTSRRNGGKPQPLSARSILEFTESGALKSAMRRGKSGQKEIHVPLSDVLRLKQEREHPPEYPMIPREPRPPKPRQLSGPDPALSVPAAAGEVLEPWSFLTLEEAGARVRLPASYLLKLIYEGKIRALDVGKREGGSWRIRREDVERIEGELHHR